VAVTESLNHSVWDCKYHVVFMYHVVFIPTYRRKVLYKKLRRYPGEVFHDLVAQRESRIVEGHLMGDHVHTLISIPPSLGGTSFNRFERFTLLQASGFAGGHDLWLSASRAARAWL